MSDIVKRLEDWRVHDFHADRQLADEILLADGWKVEPDAGFEGGFRWYIGTNPQYSSSEGQRPHPIHDLNAAFGLLPRNYQLRLLKTETWTTAEVTSAHGGNTYKGQSDNACIAVCIACMKAIEAVI